MDKQQDINYLKGGKNGKLQRQIHDYASGSREKRR